MREAFVFAKRSRVFSTERTRDAGNDEVVVFARDHEYRRRHTRPLHGDDAEAELERRLATLRHQQRKEFLAIIDRRPVEHQIVGIGSARVNRIVQ
jgi:hypothetical protein